MTLSRLVVPLALVALLCASPGGAASLKGVEVPDSIQVDGHDLRLQGVGLRKKFVFSVYVGALYLTTPTADAGAAIAADEPKRIEMHFLRNVGGDSMEEAFREGFFNNAQEKLGRLGLRIDAFVRLFAGGVKKGEAVTLTYLPGKGVSAAFAGVEKGAIEGTDFMQALWAIWLGEVPADHDLKKGMLGGQ